MNLFLPTIRRAALCGFLGGALFYHGELQRETMPLHAAPQLDAQDQKVINRLSWLLNKRVKKPNGSPINVSIVPTARASEGYFSQITMSGSPAQLKKKFRVSQFNLDARNVHLDVASLWNGNRVKTFQSQTKLRAVITEDDLTSMLAQGGATKSMGLKIKFLGNRIGVTGNLNYALINGPINGVGQLRMAPGHKVYLDILSLKLRGVEVPGFIKNQFSNHINPVIAYEDLPFNPPFKGIKMVGKKAVLST
ncbi:Protein of unknown function (DUF2993) [Abditibacterium utsteinense]|uniref:Uncharacterized protein n=1 Tax=Abditibacterium utsteinense TaxID=1960156 RepID=A0A2S8SW88_9BACT|nr:DUF2993 domain-containing protein [Abditibacterium utsteinense]PQV65047.1 Protein of unknown function (DUF2993) [Abditibacterium utsteinense]